MWDGQSFPSPLTLVLVLILILVFDLVLDNLGLVF